MLSYPEYTCPDGTKEPFGFVGTGFLTSVEMNDPGTFPPCVCWGVGAACPSGGSSSVSFAAGAAAEQHLQQRQWQAPPERPPSHMPTPLARRLARNFIETFNRLGYGTCIGVVVLDPDDNSLLHYRTYHTSKVGEVPDESAGSTPTAGTEQA